MIAVYAPSDNESIIVKENFFTKLHIVIIEIGNNRKILFLEDFNSRRGRRKKE